MNSFLPLLLFSFFCTSCQEAGKKAVEEPATKSIAGSDVLRYVSKYLKHDLDLAYEDSMFHSQQPKPVGDVNGDGKADSVFVMSPMDSTEYYFSFYFLDTTIPRLSTVSYCMESDFIFRVDDINEDGKQELGLMNFSCNSSTQSLETYSLKNGEWKRLGRCTYDMNFEDELPMEQRIVKTGKGKFKMLHVNYDAVEDTLIKEWRKFSF